jgi:hypothetical protein
VPGSSPTQQPIGAAGRAAERTRAGAPPARCHVGSLRGSEGPQLQRVPAQISDRKKDRKIMCKITHLVRAAPYLHHFRSNTSESRTPSRSREVGIVICGTRKYGVKGRRDGEERVFMRVKHGLGSRREGSPRDGGRSSRWHACKRRVFAASLPAFLLPASVASSPDPECRFQRLKGARLRVDAPLFPCSAGLGAQTEKVRKNAPRFSTSSKGYLHADDVSAGSLERTRY